MTDDRKKCWQRVMLEGAVDNVNRGIPNPGHTSSDCLSRRYVLCKYAVGQVNTEVVIVIHTQCTTVVVVEC
jgi:hypothetical protein